MTPEPAPVNAPNQLCSGQIELQTQSPRLDQKKNGTHSAPRQRNSQILNASTSHQSQITSHLTPATLPHASGSNPAVSTDLHRSSHA
jgi:hypothetical protein